MRNLGARRCWALGAVCLAVVAVGVDSMVLSVALPTLARALHASESDLQWFSSGFLLVLAAAMLPAATAMAYTADHIPRPVAGCPARIEGSVPVVNRGTSMPSYPRRTYPRRIIATLAARRPAETLRSLMIS